MTWRYEREDLLLRFAPWADLSTLRALLITACENTLRQWGPELDEFAEAFNEYVAGEHGVLPNIYEFQRGLANILQTKYSQYESDSRWSDARAELKRYFFFARHWKHE